MYELIPLKTCDIVVVGKGQSDLEDIGGDAAKKVGRYIAAESHPEAGNNYRSDHFNFAKAGIPALYITTGSDVEVKGKVYGQRRQDDYKQNFYHCPTLRI